MVYDEVFTALENLFGCVVIPAGCTLQIENSLNLSFEGDRVWDLAHRQLYQRQSLG
jgi:hypothetical protein